MTDPREISLPATTPPPWTTQLAHRFRHHFVLKTVGISVFMWVFFMGYFHLLRHPTRPPLEMPLTALDRAIGFQPGWLAIYLSLWFYVGIAPGLMLGLRSLIVHGLWAAALCLSGLACFYWWPTAVPPLAIDVSGYAGFAMLQGVDAAGNACPSLHVATAVFSACWIHRVLRDSQAPTALHLLNGAWVLAIAYSTLAVKQHVAWDALAGALLGALFAATSLRWRPRAQPSEQSELI